MSSVDHLVADATGHNHGSDDVLLERVLLPYRANCHYLKSAQVAGGEPAEGGRLMAACEFEILESCYIDDTGHFNAVEFNICYNQMLYYLLAKSVQSRLARPFSGWTMDGYWKRQLADILIVEFHSIFRRGMRGRRFFGEIEIVDIAEWEGSDIREPLVVLDTVCRYWDDDGGDCQGKVKIAITHPPESGC